MRARSRRPTTCEVEGQGDPLALAPAIGGLDQWYVEATLSKFRSGLRGAHPEDIGGMRMGPMSRSLRSEEDVQDVADRAHEVGPVADQGVGAA